MLIDMVVCSCAECCLVLGSPCRVSTQHAEVLLSNALHSSMRVLWNIRGSRCRYAREEPRRVLLHLLAAVLFQSPWACFALHFFVSCRFCRTCLSCRSALITTHFLACTLGLLFPILLFSGMLTPALAAAACLLRGVLNIVRGTHDVVNHTLDRSSVFPFLLADVSRYAVLACRGVLNIVYGTHDVVNHILDHPDIAADAIRLSSGAFHACFMPFIMLPLSSVAPA